MERHEILEAMSELKLYGMRASFDEVAGKGFARIHLSWFKIAHYYGQTGI
jgi:hypothetical protein